VRTRQRACFQFMANPIDQSEIEDAHKETLTPARLQELYARRYIQRDLLALPRGLEGQPSSHQQLHEP
jgi:hypothetical protein